jgi:hypothetical protein
MTERRFWTWWLTLVAAGVLFWLVVFYLVGEATVYARNPAVVRAFRATHPCPSTGKTEGRCPGYVVDHKYPLCAGGVDTVANMRWQAEEDSYIKDRIERELCEYKKRAP